MKFSIENLANDANEQEVRRLFSFYGKVCSIKLSLGSLHSRYPGSGIVEMEDDDAGNVVAALDRCTYRGAVLRVKETRSPDEAAASVEDAAQKPAGPGVAEPNNRIHNTLRVISVEKLVESEAGQLDGWCRYTITSGASNITGQRAGTVAEVTQYAQEMADAFNERNMLKRGRSQVWTSRSKKK